MSKFSQGDFVKVIKNTDYYQKGSPNAKKLGTLTDYIITRVHKYYDKSDTCDKQYQVYIIIDGSTKPYYVYANRLRASTKEEYKKYLEQRNSKVDNGTNTDTSAAVSTSSSTTTSTGTTKSSTSTSSSSSSSSSTVYNTKAYSKYVNAKETLSSSEGATFTLSSSGRNLFSNNDDIKRVLLNLGIIDREATSKTGVTGLNHSLTRYYDRTGTVDPYNGFAGSKEYVFFTRPDLHLFKNTSSGSVALNTELSGSSFFQWVKTDYTELMYSLQESKMTVTTPFIPLLSNTINSSVELPSITANRNLESGANAFGSKIHYRGTSHPSDEDITLNIEFVDNRYLEVFMLFKIYDEYQKERALGKITPRLADYTYNKILYDKMSIFKIVVGEDGETIQYFAKWTGVMPTNVPTDSLTDLQNLTGNLSYNISWHAEFFEDLDIDILIDFNVLVAQQYKSCIDAGKSPIPLYDGKTMMSNGEWATTPFIARVELADDQKISSLSSDVLKMRHFKLKWI